ncbi:MAG: hypothetical protein AAFO91_02030, partial [Bacteroidota bacterium]
MVFDSAGVRAAVFMLLLALLIQPVSLVYAAEDGVEEGTEADAVIELDEEPEIDAISVSLEEAVAEVEEEVEEESVIESLEETADELESEDAETEVVIESTDDEVEQVGTTTNESREGHTTEGADRMIDAASSTEVMSSSTVVLISTTTEAVASSTEAGSGVLDEVATTSATSSTSSTTAAEASNNEDDQKEVDEELAPKIDTDDSVAESVVATSTKSASSTDELEVRENSGDGSESVESATTPPVAGEATNRNRQNYYQFGREDCVTVGDGSFYCGTATEHEELEEDTFFVGTDSDGDQEIFARVHGETVQLTHNTVNDAAPYYDALSNSLVWHRLVQDRYQIMRRSFETNVDEVLTQNNVNDMEPRHFGDHVVWQRWVVDNWEIILFDGETYTQLTDNGVHDLAPSIRNNFVLWKTVRGEEQDVTVYDLSTGEFTSIQDEEAGSSVQNPRLMFVYETLSDTGDVVTKGFDPIRGEVIPIGVLPVELPDEIPESDQTGETRALIQNKNALGREESDDETDETGPRTIFDGASSAASSSEQTLVIPIQKGTSTVASSSSPTLIIPALERSTSSAT